MSGNKKLRT